MASSRSLLNTCRHPSPAIRTVEYPQFLIDTIGQFGYIWALLGGVSEWSKETVLKTVVPLRVPWVRIPPPPYTLSVQRYNKNA